MRGRREGGDLLVAHLDELQAVVDVVEGTREAVDAITGIAVDPIGPPSRQRGARA